MKITLEKLINLVVSEVIKELKKQGVEVISYGDIKLNGNPGSNLSAKVERIDMSKYITPILTENHIRRLHELTGEVIVPEGTIITPKARELIRDRRISVVME